MQHLNSLAATAWVTLAVACTTTHVGTPPIDQAPRAVVELARFEVRHQGVPIGAVVQLEIQDPAGPIRFWRVQNRNGAWLGHATEQGRFSRRLPFRDDELDLGVWPMEQGVARLFDLEGGVALRPVDAAVPASARRQP